MSVRLPLTIRLENSTLTPLENSYGEMAKAFFWGICEVICEVALYLIAGVAALFFWPSLSSAFFAYAGAIVVTRLLVRASERHDLSFIKRIKMQADHLVKKMPRLELIALVIAIAVSALSGFLGVLLAVPVGAFSGIMIGMRKTEREIQAERLRPAQEDLIYL